MFATHPRALMARPTIPIIARPFPVTPARSAFRETRPQSADGRDSDRAGAPVVSSIDPALCHRPTMAA